MAPEVFYSFIRLYNPPKLIKNLTSGPLELRLTNSLQPAFLMRMCLLWRWSSRSFNSLLNCRETILQIWWTLYTVVYRKTLPPDPMQSNYCLIPLLGMLAKHNFYLSYSKRLACFEESSSRPVAKPSTTHTIELSLLWNWRLLFPHRKMRLTFEKKCWRSRGHSVKSKNTSLD